MYVLPEHNRQKFQNGLILYMKILNVLKFSQSMDLPDANIWELGYGVKNNPMPQTFCFYDNTTVNGQE